MTEDTFQRRELLDIAVAAARQAAAIQLDTFRRPDLQIAMKGDVDLVTEADTRSEARIREILEKETGFSILGEEGGLEGSAEGPLWIVDPLDGTTNFTHGFPHFAVSIGLWHEDRARVGVVLQPVTGELATSDGTEARIGGQVLPKLETRSLGRALLGTGFPYDRQQNADQLTSLVARFLRRCQGVRRLGAAALDLAWVAAGRLDGFWEPRLKPWDVAGGLALLETVGAISTDYAGKPWNLDSGSLVCGRPGLQQEMLAVIADGG